MLSSIKSEGAVGAINGIVARIRGQKDADVIYWIKSAGEPSHYKL